MTTSQPINVAIALVRKDELWLVARRRADSHLGDLWEFPGGKCQPGESATAAALRELREETGVTAMPRETLGTFRHDYGDRVVNITAVLCQWQSGDPHPRAAQACRWVATAELLELEMPAVNAQIVRAAVAVD